MDSETFEAGVLCVRWIREWFEVLGNVGRDVFVTDHFSSSPEVHRVVLALLITHSRVERTAWDALSEIAQRTRQAGDPLPAQLTEWIDDRNAGRHKRPSKRGPDRYANHVRDQIIVSSVQELEDSGFLAMRNPRLPRGVDLRQACPEGGSACDAVGVAFEAFRDRMNYKAVEKVWVASAKPETATDREFLKPHCNDLLRWMYYEKLANK